MTARKLTPAPSLPLLLQPLTPRQTRLLNGHPELHANQAGTGVVMEESPDFSYDSKDARRAQRERLQK